MYNQYNLNNTHDINNRFKFLSIYVDWYTIFDSIGVVYRNKVRQESLKLICVYKYLSVEGTFSVVSRHFLFTCPCLELDKKCLFRVENFYQMSRMSGACLECLERV